jgi:hypothetical protein
LSGKHKGERKMHTWTIELENGMKIEIVAETIRRGFITGEIRADTTKINFGKAVINIYIKEW